MLDKTDDIELTPEEKEFARRLTNTNRGVITADEAEESYREGKRKYKESQSKIPEMMNKAEEAYKNHLIH